MEMFNSIRKAAKSVKTFGLLGLVAVLMAGFAAAPAAPASAAEIAGKLDVYTLNESGAPVANATVLVLNGNGQRMAKVLTNVDGNVRIKLIEGEYKLVVSADNYKEFSQMAKVAAAQVSTLKIGLVSNSATGTVGSTSTTGTVPAPVPSTSSPLPIGKLSVQALDPTSSRIIPGIAGATVLVVNGNGQQVAKGLTNDQGIFEAKITEDIYKVTITADNYKEYSEVVKLVANQVTTVKAELGK
jgi:5-hydroxyisourate hydrolase-like protein (transthyretin family)